MRHPTIVCRLPERLHYGVLPVVSGRLTIFMAAPWILL